MPEQNFNDERNAQVSVLGFTILAMLFVLCAATAAAVFAYSGGWN
jgi:hypothetical protein